MTPFASALYAGAMELVLDIYDDPTAQVLKSRLVLDARGPLEKLASVKLAEIEELDAMPDRLFALVADHEGQQIRKYAMHDPAHLATSIAYFLECGPVLPQETRQKVARNLVNACGWYDTDPPEPLVKLALMGALTAGLGAMQLPGVLRKGKAVGTASMDALRAAQVSGLKTAAGRAVSASEFDDELGRFIRGEEPEVAYDSFNTQYPNPFAGTEKDADITGTEVGSQGALSNDPRGRTPQAKMPMASKTSAWQHCGDLTGALRNPAPKLAEATHFALPERGLYPLDTPDQVKTASAYFEEYRSALEQDERHVFANAVVARAEELGVKVAGSVLRFAGDDYGPRIEAELQGRVNATIGTGREDGYMLLLEKRAEIPAPVMYSMLKELDTSTGLDNLYGRAVVGHLEPAEAVFGKIAEGPWSWSGKGHYVSEDTLRNYAEQAPEIDHIFGDRFSQRFVVDPTKGFDSLSDDQKVILSRFANGAANRSQF